MIFIFIFSLNNKYLPQNYLNLTEKYKNLTEKLKISQKKDFFKNFSVRFSVRIYFFCENLTEFCKFLVISQKFCEIFTEKINSHRKSHREKKKIKICSDSGTTDLKIVTSFARKSPAMIFVYLGDKVKFWKKKFQNLKVDTSDSKGLFLPKIISEIKNKKFKICLILGWMNSERKSYCMYILVI